jgi:hypothetical protein
MPKRVLVLYGKICMLVGGIFGSKLGTAMFGQITGTAPDVRSVAGLGGQGMLSTLCSSTWFISSML